LVALRTLIVPIVTAGLAVSTGISAHVPAPMIPTALVEDVKSATADIEFMDYVGTGQVLKLEPGDVLVLNYLKSCEHETIRGGTVRVGAEHSEVQDGQVVRAKVSRFRPNRDSSNVTIASTAAKAPSISSSVST
jgi:hypothetical protein